MAPTRPSLAFALLALLFCACDLPQNKPKPSESDGGATDGGDGTIRTWRMLRLADEGGAESEETPGADIDAIVVYRDDVFLAAGCSEASLFGESRETPGENPFLDPAGASLAVREGSELGGFVSLGGGTLLCELPVAVQTGDRIEVWEMEVDGADGWLAAVAESAGDSFTEVGTDSFEGAAEFTVP